MGFFNRAVYAALIFCLLFGSGCRPSQTLGPPPLASQQDFKSKPDLVMRDIDMQSYGPQGKEWAIVASTGQGYTSNSLFHVINMIAELYEKGEKTATIQSAHGFMDGNPGSPSKAQPLLQELTGFALEPGDMFARGDVVVISTEGHRLNTEWLHYHKKTDLITSTAPVRVVRKDSVLDGVGLESTPNLSNLKIFNQTLVINDEEKKETVP